MVWAQDSRPIWGAMTSASQGNDRKTGRRSPHIPPRQVAAAIFGKYRNKCAAGVFHALRPYLPQNTESCQRRDFWRDCTIAVAIADPAGQNMLTIWFPVESRAKD